MPNELKARSERVTEEDRAEMTRQRSQ